jgi:hypothetical protein
MIIIIIVVLLLLAVVGYLVYELFLKPKGQEKITTTNSPNIRTFNPITTFRPTIFKTTTFRPTTFRPTTFKPSTIFQPTTFKPSTTFQPTTFQPTTTQSPIPTQPPIPPLYSFKTHTFTNAGAVGSTGPTLTAVRSAYSGASWAQDTTNNYLNMKTQGIQEWTVPVTGIYTIRAVGAKGGDSLDGNSGGRGIDISTTTTLNKGEIIKILVGQTGKNTDSISTGGGGGTFVVRGTQTPIIIAGGGGGGMGNQAFSSYSGVNKGGDGLSTTSGGGGGVPNGYPTTLISPGKDGNGATTTVPNGTGMGGQGGGLLSDGTNNPSEPSGKGFINGGQGGSPTGGFGGGASGYNNGPGYNAGGGGGYSGGAGGFYNTASNPSIDWRIPSGGGGSYAISTMTNNGATNTGQGSVTITLQ